MINPLPHDDVHAEGDSGLKTDQVNSSKKYVTKTTKNKDRTAATRNLRLRLLQIWRVSQGRYYTMLTLL